MHLFFDLDGTLVDSLAGIARSINHALVEGGHRPVPVDRLRLAVGRPLAAILRELFDSRDAELIRSAVASYRLHYDRTAFDDLIAYDGIADALEAFRRSGHAMQIVTAKPAATARRVVKAAGIGQYFDAVHGPDPHEDVRDKAGLVAAALAHAHAAPAEAVMIGDRAVDVAAARAHGVAAVAVAWGYGARRELLDARPNAVVEHVSDLVRWVADAAVSAPAGDDPERVLE